MHAISPSAAYEQADHTPSYDTLAAHASTCCVALRVQETQDRPQQDVEILSEIPRVAIGEPEVTLRGLVAYRFTGATRERILDRIDQIGCIDPCQPLSLERLQVWDGGLAVHLEAHVLPISEEQAGELEEFLRDPEGPQMRHELAWEYAQDLVGLWSDSMPAGMPVCFIDDPVEDTGAIDGTPIALAPAPPTPPLPVL